MVTGTEVQQCSTLVFAPLFGAAHNADSAKNEGIPLLNVDKYLCSDYVVYIDTCSLLSESAPEFLRNLGGSLWASRKKLYILDSVRKEFSQVSKSSAALRNRANTVCHILNELLSKGLVRYIPTQNKGFSDVNFISIFVSQIVTNNILLITEDNALVNVCRNLKASIAPAVNTKYDISIRKLNRSS